jgi:hypothetical protein
MDELIFIVEEDAEGGFRARALGESIHTQADTIEELHTMVREAVACHYDTTPPRLIRLHYVKDEVLTNA